jgi:hypothetical protein
VKVDRGNEWRRQRIEYAPRAKSGAPQNLACSPVGNVGPSAVRTTNHAPAKLGDSRRLKDNAASSRTPSPIALTELVCPCGKTFKCTVAGVRAGRKWCSGSCQDRHSPFNLKKKEWMRAYGHPGRKQNVRRLSNP